MGKFNWREFEERLRERGLEEFEIQTSVGNLKYLCEHPELKDRKEYKKYFKKMQRLYRGKVNI